MEEMERARGDRLRRRRACRIRFILRYPLNQFGHPSFRRRLRLRMVRLDSALEEEEGRTGIFRRIRPLLLGRLSIPSLRPQPNYPIPILVLILILSFSISNINSPQRKISIPTHRFRIRLRSTPYRMVHRRTIAPQQHHPARRYVDQHPGRLLYSIRTKSLRLRKRR